MQISQKMFSVSFLCMVAILLNHVMSWPDSEWNHSEIGSTWNLKLERFLTSCWLILVCCLETGAETLCKALPTDGKTGLTSFFWYPSRTLTWSWPLRRRPSRMDSSTPWPQGTGETSGRLTRQGRASPRCSTVSPLPPHSLTFGDWTLPLVGMESWPDPDSCITPTGGWSALLKHLRCGTLYCRLHHLLFIQLVEVFIVVM